MIPNILVLILTKLNIIVKFYWKYIKVTNHD